MWWLGLFRVKRKQRREDNTKTQREFNCIYVVLIVVFNNGSILRDKVIQISFRHSFKKNCLNRTTKQNYQSVLHSEFLIEKKNKNARKLDFKFSIGSKPSKKALKNTIVNANRPTVYTIISTSKMFLIFICLKLYLVLYRLVTCKLKLTLNLT